MRRSRVAYGLAAVALVVAGAVAVQSGLASIEEAPSPSDGPPGSPGGSPGGSPATDDPANVPAPPDLSLPRLRPPVPPTAADGPTPRRAAVRAALAPVLSDPDLGRHVGVVVRDLARDRAVLTIGDPGRFVPASTLKLFTAAAALAELGPTHRFGTRVELAPTGGNGAAGRPRAIVLVGGGDPLLASRRPDPDLAGAAPTVSVAGLAARTASALRDRGVRRVRVGYDASLFTGPSAAATWEPDYLPDDIVSPVSALWVDEGRVTPDFAERSADPAGAAGVAFAEALQRRGIRVVGGPQPTASAPSAELLVEQLGAPLDSVVEHLLLLSDNEATEVLLRHVAIVTGRPASFAGGVAAVREVLVRLGVPYAGVETYDGSGLSRANRITLPALAAVLQLGTDPAQPALRSVTAGLPVARFTGSLAYRFLAADAVSGRGLVRAKTGTLTGVHGLAGTVVTRDQSLLGFGLLTDEVPRADTLDARALLDEMAAALAGCGCG